MSELHTFVWLNQVDKVRQFLDAHPTAVNRGNRKGETALHKIDWGCGYSMLKLLLARSADPVACDRAGYTALHNALSSEATLRECQLLCAQTPELVHIDLPGIPPLVWAALFSRRSIVEWLLNEGADINATDKLGQTALMLAAIRKNGSARLLVGRGADVTRRNVSGDTALHYAANHGRLATVKMLMKHGADPLIRGYRKCTPSDRAQQSGQTATVRFLRKSVQ